MKTYTSELRLYSSRKQTYMLMNVFVCLFFEKWQQRKLSFLRRIVHFAISSRQASLTLVLQAFLITALHGVCYKTGKKGLRQKVVKVKDQCKALSEGEIVILLHPIVNLCCVTVVFRNSPAFVQFTKSNVQVLVKGNH